MLTRRDFLHFSSLLTLSACSNAFQRSAALLPPGISPATTPSPAPAWQGTPFEDSLLLPTFQLKDVRPLRHKALIMAGGQNEGGNCSAFFFEALIWQHLLKKIFGLQDSDIRTLYFKGEHPQPENLLAHAPQTATLS